VRKDADIRQAAVERGVSCGAPCTGHKERIQIVNVCTLLVTLCSAQNNTAHSTVRLSKHEGSLGLSILVSIIRCHGNDYFQSYCVLRCQGFGVCDVIRLHNCTDLCVQQLSQPALCTVHVITDVGPAWPKHVTRLLCITYYMLC